MPKSTIFTLPSMETIRLWGETSRCTSPKLTPLASVNMWAYWSPWQTWLAMQAMCCIGMNCLIDRSFRRMSSTVYPGTYSIAM
jgi:hypothetical protein